MNSWTSVFLFYGLAWNLASCEPSLEAPRENISQPDLNCNFDEGFCSWKDVSTSDHLEWQHYSFVAPEYSENTGPSRDHTTGRGFFLGMRSPYSHSPGSALLESPMIESRDETCLSFWYFMHGDLVGGLNVYKIGLEGAKKEVFAMFGPMGKRWYRAVVNSGDGTFKLQFEATFGGKDVKYGDIAIDDVMFSYHACQEDDSTLHNVQPRFDCDFEHDFCSWYFQRQSALSWIINSYYDSDDRYALPPGSDGISYVRMERRSRDYDGELELLSPSISVDSKKACMSFWYKLYGTAIDFFWVRMYEYGTSAGYGGKTLFQTGYKPGDSTVWIKGLVTLPEGNHSRMAFFVQTDRQRYGSIALDDVRLTYGGPCTEGEEGGINCNFETGFCRWYMTTRKHENDWLRNRGATPTNATGPSNDHTTGGGYYIFLDASEVDEANLHSPQFSVNSSGACLSFWYYMHGADVNSLQLKSEDIGWSLEGPQGDKWIQQNISLNAGQNIKLVFTAKRGYFPRGDIALDDISIAFGAPCESDSKKETTVPTNIYPEISTVETSATAETTTTTRTTPEVRHLDTPQLLVKGKIHPAYNNSRIELVCQHDEEGVRIGWYRRYRTQTFYNGGNRLPQSWGGNRIVIEKLGPHHEGVYWCVLEYEYQYEFDYRMTSNNSNEVDIRVVPDPRPRPQLEITSSNPDDLRGTNPLDMLVDGVVKVACGDKVPDDGVEYLWSITDPPREWISRNRVHVINGTRPEDSGVYSCQIRKDGFLTAKSNELRLIVKPGQRCKYHYTCYGDEVKEYCRGQRCRCINEAVVYGRGCRRIPETPEITTYPIFLEFGIGESFYVVCEADEPAPASLTYTFKSHSNGRKGRKFKKEPLSIMKITNATAKDTGYYSCSVIHNGIHSKQSDGIYIQVKDFMDLNCNFDKDFCVWHQENGTDTANFTLTYTVTNDLRWHRRNSGPSGPYIQLEASNTVVPNRAVLVSPAIDRMALDSCLTFWYRMHGTDVHSLSVWSYAYSKKLGHFMGSKLWTVIGNKGDTWHRQHVTVTSETNFYIAFDAIGQAAIDNISFTYRGAC